MAERNLQIRVGVNLGSTESRLKALNTNLKNIKSEFKNASAGVDNFGKTSTGMNAKVKTLNDTLSTLNSKSDLLKTKMNTAKSSLESATQSYEKQKKKVSELRDALDVAKTSYGENSAEVKALEKELASAERELSSFEKTVISADNNVVNLDTQMNNLEAEIKKVTKELKQAEDALSGATWTKVGTAIEDAGKKMQTTGSAIINAGKSLSIVSTAVSGIGVYSLKTAAEFDSAMSKVKAISKASSEDMELLTAKAREMGKNTSFSAKEAANGLEYMALAGWSTDQMLEGLEPILRLAEAGSLDLALASDLVTDSMGALGIKLTENGDELYGYLDKVAKASTISNQSVEQMTKALINCGGQAQSLNIPVSELGGALGVLADNGTKGEEAGNKLNSIITRMTAQSTKAQKAWKELNVDVFDSDRKSVV